MTIHFLPVKGAPRVLSGPGDLAGRTSGTVVLSGAADDDKAAYWAVPLGLFAARGGEIRWEQR